jgi:hypothetical protein
MVLALQRSGTSAMAATKSIDWKNVQISAMPEPTIGLFAHAAVVANLLVVTIVVIVFSFFAFKEHALATLRLLLWLIPLVTLAVWCSASAVYFTFLAAKLFRALEQRLFGSSSKSVLWDDRLDSP